MQICFKSTELKYIKTNRKIACKSPYDKQTNKQLYVATILEIRFIFSLHRSSARLAADSVDGSPTKTLLSSGSVHKIWYW